MSKINVAKCDKCGSDKEENHKCILPDILSCEECRELGIKCTYDHSKCSCHFTHHITL